MLRKARAIGWGLIALAVAAAAVVVTVGAFRAHGDAAFTRWVGWAAIAVLPVTAVGVALALWEKIALGATSSDLGIEEIETELAAAVLSQSQVARSRLIGAEQVSDEAANVRFVKGGRFREVGGANEGDLATVLSYFQSLSPARLVILGEPGTGKTVLALELLIRLLEHRRHDPARPIPVLISASAYDIQLEWQDWLARHLALRFGIGTAATGRLVRDGRILPIVDGLDEMDLAGSPPQRATILVKELNGWMRGLQRAPVVLTCRYYEYQSLAQGVDRATHIQMIPLTGKQAADYLRGQFLSPDEEKRWESMLAKLDANQDGPLVAQLATPWRLTLALAAFRSSGDPTMLLPSAPALTGTEAEQYTRGVNGLLFGSFVSSAIQLHKAGGYTQTQVQHWLTVLADGLAWQAHHNESATDILLSEWWRPMGRLTIRLVHCGLAAICIVPWLISGAVSGSLNWIGIAGLLLICAVVINLPSFPPHKLRIRQITSRHRLRRFVAGFSSGFALGMMFGSTAGFAKGFGAGFVAALVCGFTFGLTAGFVTWLADDLPEDRNPRDVIRADGLCGLTIVISIMIALVVAVTLSIALVTGLTFNWVTGPASVLSIIYIISLGFFANAWTRYYATVITMAVRRQSPLHFIRFLDWAQQAGLLRVSGVAYQFRHRQLQDWLASRSATAEGIIMQQNNARDGKPTSAGTSTPTRRHDNEPQLP